MIRIDAAVRMRPCLLFDPAAIAVLSLALAACAGPAGKEAEEAAKNTLACQFNGERLLIRFESGEARLLLPGSERVTLYRIPASSGQRFSNGTMELRGSGTDFQVIQDGQGTRLVDCAPYVPPK